MRKLKFLTLLFAIALISCERDDICPEGTPTTPRLIVEFYDAANTDDLKSVTRLTAYGEGLLTEPPVEETNETIVFDSNVNRLELPLIIGEEGLVTTTSYVLEKDTNLRDEGNSNEDILTISYTNEYDYVSRACGYKNIFNDIIVTFTQDGNTWITSIQVDEINVENENTVHVRILH
ncbi:DUF6452 family protein [Winogradskyella sp.]|uniref:DUF6452 family protein n=1 Tax=Winogradskyella sp. TaxID=1883156 RepID=UPI003F6CFD95